MAEKGNEISKIDDLSLQLHGSDHPGIPLITTVLDGRNYWPWSIGIRTALEAKDKIGFVDGSIKPPEDPSEHRKWKKADSMVKSWLTNSISKEISKLFIFCLTSKALWDVLEERYGVNNAPQMYHLQRYTSSITQGSDQVNTYFNKINRCWDELGRLMPLPTCTCGKCTCDVNKKIADQDGLVKLMQFLMGLTPNFDVIRTQILNSNLIPSLNKAYAMVISKETQKQVNVSYSSMTEGSSALMAKTFQGKNEGEASKRRDISKKDKFCDHCKGKGHTRDVCFKIYGYPEWFKEMKEKRAAMQKKQMANLTSENAADTPVSQESESNNKGDLTNMVSYLMKEVQRLNKAKAKDEQDQKSRRILAKGAALGNLYYLDTRNLGIDHCNSKNNREHKQSSLLSTNTPVKCNSNAQITNEDNPYSANASEVPTTPTEMTDILPTPTHENDNPPTDIQQPNPELPQVSTCIEKYLHIFIMTGKLRMAQRALYLYVDDQKEMSFNLNPLRYGQFHVGENSDFQFLIQRHLHICSEFGLMEFYVEISTHNINMEMENQLSFDYNTQPTPQTDQLLLPSSSQLQNVATYQSPTDNFGEFSDEDEYEASVHIRMAHQDEEDDNVGEDVFEEELANFYSQVDMEGERGFTGDLGPHSEDAGELYEGMKFPTKPHYVCM
ncbi:uncharacterized protein G2W53_009391 [Senna tora]|uniref:Retrotransposon Copia-like N-terminal domain-containing protein n=1 Tax=Senna tora TaxID=362788 RepID=A0A834WXZ1_9FABA|nr:uncharacterized protein G2W53_009391 [Senna tora]